jgi:hypothetical protein
MLFIGDGWRREYRFPKVLRDEQWRSVNIVGFQDKYRNDIDEGIGLYRELNRNAEEEYGLAAATKAASQVSALVDAERGALRQLENVISNESTLNIIQYGLQGQLSLAPEDKANIGRWLEQEIDRKETALIWYEALLLRIRRQRQRGNRDKRTALRALVSYLAILYQEHTGQKISRSDKKDFIWRVCNIADGRLQKNIVAQAIKEIREDDWYQLLPFFSYELLAVVRGIDQQGAPQTERKRMDASTVIITRHARGHVTIESKGMQSSHRRVFAFVDLFGNARGDKAAK